MNRNWLILIPVLAVLLLGQVGLARAGSDADILTRLYLTLQLFALEGDWTSGFADLPWELELARFLAPVATIASLILVFASEIRIAISNVRARFARGHVVTAGLSEPVWNFLLACERRGRRVTVVTERTDNALVAQTRRLGHRVIEVDRIDGDALRAASLTEASHLVVFTPDDGDNVEIALRAKRLLRDEGGPGRDAPLQIRLHLDDTRLATRLEDYPKFFEDYAAAEVSFFNVHERSARLLFAEHAMEMFADALDASRVHMAIVGTGPLQEQVLLHALRQAHFADGAAPRVSLMGEDVQSAFDEFRSAHPGASEVGEIDCIEVPYTDTDMERILPRDRLQTVTAWVVCLEPDVAALRYTLALRRALLAGCGGNGPIFVAMRHGHGLARLLESGTGDPEVPDGIFPFGMLDEALADDQILDERQDALAREFHSEYLAGFDRIPEKEMHVRPAYRPWNLLPEVFRRENRTQADHLEVKLRATDRLLSHEGDTRPFGDEEIERLAEIEQRRWSAVRRCGGWRFGEKRSDLDKVHNAIRPWADLPDATRQQNRGSIRGLVRITDSRLDMRCRPCVFVGVTGHRPNRLGTDLLWIEEALAATFAAILDAYTDHQLVLLSPLAEGADRIAARIAVERFGAELYVPLPLPYELYVGSFGVSPDFDQDDSSVEFRRLVGLARRYFEMPLRFGTFAELADPSAEQARARQYALCGAWIVQRCHELVGVWDGADAAGEGGTPQILRWRSEGVPAPYAFGNHFYPDRGHRPPWLVPTERRADFVPARATL